ncbi:hypothetical protein [Streptomyces mirabilis]|uniref:hypothetical protein n=1 Tax=Streptomyces mirabilis TaxID=68239 RepID=UPI003676BAE9
MGSPASTVTGLLAELHDRLRDKVREKEGRLADPTAAIVDSQSVRAAANIPRSTQEDLLLNTASLPAHWFTGINALPPPETWPTVPRAALRNRYVALLNPSTGACISGPTGLTCNPVTGLQVRHDK